MKKIGLLLVVGLLLIAIPATIFLVGKNQELRQRAAPATSLAFTPAAISKKVGDTFSMDITIDTGPNQVVAAELHLVFDPAALEAQTITNGPLFPNILASGVVDRGTASITVGAQSATSPVTGTGTVATVKFKALAPTSAPISVRLAPNTFVGGLGEGSTNVLTGSSPATVTITDASGATGTTTVTPSPTPAANLTPTPTLRAGITPTPTPRVATASAQTATSSAVVITSPVKNASSATAQPTISGKATPGSTVTLTIYSTPQTVVVTADANGNWIYTPTTPLDPGPHSVVATATTPTGSTQTTTTSFVVAGAGQAGATLSAQPVSGTVEVTYLLITLAIVFVISGIMVPVVIR